MKKKYCVAFWNLENLFAPENYPDRSIRLAKEIAKDIKGWTEALFDRKLNQLSSIIAQMHDGKGPDILGVCEVENKFVLEKLIEHLSNRLPARTYKIIHHDSERGSRGIDTAFLYDPGSFSVKPEETFVHQVIRRTGTRDITQVTFVTKNGVELVTISNHWPSRFGGNEFSGGFRIVAGETLAYWHERIREKKGGDVAVLAFGDFNDDPFDPSMIGHAQATRERSDVTRARSARFYNISWQYLNQNCIDQVGKKRRLEGTLYFRGTAFIFDQILLSKGLLKTTSPLRSVDETARIEAYPEMVSRRASPEPIRFGLPKGNPNKNVNQNGYSDHYPVSVVLEEKI